MFVPQEKLNATENPNASQTNENSLTPIEKEGPEEKDYKLKELKQLKEITRYRFNLDKKLFEMKQQRKKIISKSPNHMETAAYITSGMSFLPRTTFYLDHKNNQTFNDTKNFKVFTETGSTINERRTGNHSPILEHGKIHIINAELLKPYTRSLSPLVRKREKINLEERHLNKKHQ